MPRSAIMMTKSLKLNLKLLLPADTQDDDLSVEMPSLEQCYDWNKPLHSVIIARSRPVCTRTVLRGLPKDAGNRRCEVPATACAQPESERLRGAMGALGEERMSFAFHSVWERLVAPRHEKLREHYHGERNHQGKGNVLLFPG